MSGIGFYRWTAPEGASINGASNDEMVNVSLGSAVTITFGTQVGNVCVQTGNACHPLTAQQCLPVSLSPIPTTIKPSITVCAEDLPYTWDEDPYPTLTNPGTYVLTSSPYVSYLGCDSLVRQTIVVKSPIVVNLGVLRVCPGDCVSMAGESFCEAGNYSIVLESYLGCDSLVSFAIQQINPNATISGPTEITCSQPTVTLSSGSPTGNVWLNTSGQILGTGAQLMVDSAGIYILQTSTTAGGVTCEAYDTVSVTANLIISDLTISGAEFGCFTDSLYLVVHTSAPFPELSWQELSTGVTLFTTNDSIPVTSPGVYLLTVTDINNCTGSATVTVPYTGGTPLAQATGDTLTCAQLFGQLDGYTDEPNATFSWIGPNGFTSNEEDPVVTEPGQYVLVVTGTGGCANSATAQLVGLFDMPLANLAQSFSIICDSFPVLALQTNSSNVSFLWSGPNGFSSTQQTPQATGAGQYAVVVTDNISGCTTSASTWVFEDLVLLDIETVQITHPTIGQSNGSIDVSASGSNPPFTFDWYSNGVLIAETEDLTNVPAGDYLLVVTDSYGCFSNINFTLTGVSGSNEAFFG
ncbi:MAG: hypothetical protein JNJ57_16405, partial [Saprospiraceae bacterium]|nr:hypothetical protein [Saprospiraceae bacterium]